MIGVFDSGNGGLSVLKELVEKLPHEKYIYYADLAHCPYGGKTPEQVIARARAITAFLLEEGCCMIVIACNTATAAAISSLRSEYPSIPFVGIEPAIKPAALHTESGVIGVLATAGTLRGSNYLDLRERFSSENVRIVEQVGSGFVELVEEAFARSGIGAEDRVELDPGKIPGAGPGSEMEFGPQAEDTVRKALARLLDAGADNIVLGCTHYPFLSGLIARIAGAGVSVINPAPAVAVQASKLLPCSDALAVPKILYRRSY